MICELKIGAVWNPDTNTISGWDERRQCEGVATYLYCFATPAFKGASVMLCEEHWTAFDGWAGHTEPIASAK